MADIDKIVNDAARKAGVPVNLFRALINQESGFNPNAKSPAGAAGLSQLMPATARGLGVKNVYDPVENANAGAQYLASQYKQFKSWKLALAAYNAGPGNVTKYGGVPPFSETQHYVQTIMDAIKGQPLQAGAPFPDGAVKPASQPASLATQVAPLGDLAQVDNSADAQRRYGINDVLKSLGKLTKSPLDLSLPNIPLSMSPSATPTSSGVPTLPTDAVNVQQIKGMPKFNPKDLSWGGSKTRAIAFKNIALGNGLTIMSEKRDRKNTASGGVSDHWVGSKNAYAFDLSNGSNPTPEMDKTATQIAAMLGVPNWHSGVLNVNKGGYRYQLLYRTHVGGNHFNHVHLGVRKI